LPSRQPKVILQTKGENKMRSMTAYASICRTTNTHRIQVILRSANFKYLDIYVRNLAPEEILLEETVKRQIQKRIHRGKIEVFIFLTEPHATKIYIDQKTVGQYVSQAKALAKKYDLKADIKISDILGLPQAIFCERRVRSEEKIVLPVLKQALDKLLEFKIKKGRAIGKEMLGNLTKLKENIRRITAQKPAIGDMENGEEDIDEELSLTSFYIAKLEKKINSEKITHKGKAIDFLTQEILRELNAASSKTKKKAAALMIVEAKNYLERIREQAQNVE